MAASPSAGRRVDVGVNIASDVSAEPGSSRPGDVCVKQSHGVLIPVKSQLLFLYLLH